jgi:phosphoribosyl 1,2-cyclic phosphodiesterase
VRFASLGSGSQGNALLVEAGDTRVLLDCGFGTSDLLRRLERLDVSADQLSAVVVTHEHDDHIGGVARLARRLGLPVYLTPGTLRGLEPLMEGVDLRLVHGYARFCVGDLELSPFPVPHDAREPAQYVFSDGTRRLGVLTDTGEITAHMHQMLSGCDALLLECNHDPELLAGCNYPPSIKRRIASRFGHLDNAAAAGLLAQLDCGRLQHVIAAHLSQSNNRPDLARTALAGVLGCETESIGVATQADGFGWCAIR